jgi:hypothetical protein
MAIEHHKTNNVPDVISTALTQGQCVVVGEWRGAKPETVNYVSKKTGQPAKFSKMTHVVEVGEGNNFASIDVSEMLPDNIDLASHKVPFHKGDRVMVAVKSLEDDFGSRSITAHGIIKI